MRDERQFKRIADLNKCTPVSHARAAGLSADLPGDYFMIRPCDVEDVAANLSIRSDYKLLENSVVRLKKI